MAAAYLIKLAGAPQKAGKGSGTKKKQLEEHFATN